MSLSKQHARAGSRGAAASARETASPGKRTQVELLSASTGGHAGPRGADRGSADHAESPEAGADAEPIEASAASAFGVNMSLVKPFLTKHEGYRDVVYQDSKGGVMGYSGREGWNAAPHAVLLGCFVPR
jgi:hypothetical protein